VSLTFTGAADVNEKEELRLAALTEVMNLRIIDVLREKLGLIYGGGMEGSMTRMPYGHYTVGVTLPTGPQNVGKVIDTTFSRNRAHACPRARSRRTSTRSGRTGCRLTASRCRRMVTGWPIAADFTDRGDRSGDHPDAWRRRCMGLSRGRM
jgi:hypothetical protein